MEQRNPIDPYKDFHEQLSVLKTMSAAHGEASIQAGLAEDVLYNKLGDIVDFHLKGLAKAVERQGTREGFNARQRA